MVEKMEKRNVSVNVRFIIKEDMIDLITNDDIVKDFSDKDWNNYNNYNPNTTRFSIPYGEDDNFTIYICIGNKLIVNYQTISNGIQSIYSIIKFCYSSNDNLEFHIHMKDIKKYKEDIDEEFIIGFFEELFKDSELENITYRLEEGENTDENI